MKKATFEDLLASMNEALEHAEGKRSLNGWVRISMSSTRGP